MEKIDIIQSPDVAKYQIMIEREDFDMQRDDFLVRLTWGFHGESLTINKEDMFHDEEWNVFFMFDSSNMSGMITAECEYNVPDTDAESGYRLSVDRQILCLVTTSATARLSKAACVCKCLEQHYVNYKRTFRSDAKSLYAIVRVQPEIVTTSLGEPVRVRKHELD